MAKEKPIRLKPNLVGDIIYRYENASEFSLPKLMEDGRRLACQMFYYAELLGDVSKSYRATNVQRKVKFSELVQQFSSEGKSNAASEHLATSHKEYEELRSLEAELESRYEKGKIMFRAMEGVLNRINQDIAELRKEREHQRHLNPT